MTKDEIIVLLKEQLQLANEQLQQANAMVSSLTTQVNELIERIKSLEELLVQKGIAIDKANRQNKALGKLVSGKKSERQEKNPQDSMTQEEFDKKKTEQAEKRKARKNNGAKRDMHCEMKEVHVTIDPVMDAELLKTLRLFGTRTCIRYSMEPIKFIKTVYHINTYTDGSIMYPGKTPPALLLNSSYSPSFAAGLLQMRYIYSMPVERIIKYFADNGFTLRKATANKLIARSADVLENFYKAICQVVLQQDYVSADETYHKVLLAKTKPTDKGSKKGYLWAVSAPKLGLVFFVYEDGSRSEQVILNVFSDYKGTIQSDAYAPYAQDDKEVGKYAMEFISTALKAEGDTVKWIASLKEGIQKYPEHSFFFGHLIDYYSNNNKYDEAMQFADDMLAKDPNNTFYLYVKGYLYHNMKDYDKAIEFYKKTIEVDPNYAEAYSNLGLIYCLQAQDFSEKATTDINDPKYKEDQATLKTFYEKAKPYYEKARELKPDQKDLWLNGLYRVYYNLQMGPEFEEIEKLM